MGLARLLLALSVVFAHMPVLRGPLVNGHVAVQGFFIISGFYMALILDGKYHTDKHGLWLFYSNRLLRLFPVYFCVLAMAMLVNTRAWTLFAENWDLMSAAAAATLIGANLSLFGQDLLLFAGINGQTGAIGFSGPPMTLQGFMFIPQAWTLGVELTFYLIAPFLLNRRLWVLLAVIALSIAARWAGAQAGLVYDPWLYRFFPFELTLFLFGSLAYRAYRTIPWQRIHGRAITAMAVLPLVVMVAYPLLPHTRIFPVLRVDQAILCLVMTLSMPFLFEATRKLDWDRKIGDISYPLYLCHLLVFGLLSRVLPDVVNGFNAMIPALRTLFSDPTVVQISQWVMPTFGVLIVVVDLVLAYLLVRFVDLPVNRIRQRRFDLG